MQLKKYTTYCLDFSGKWVQACSALMGLSFFLRIVYYFGLMSLRDVGIVEILTSAILNILLCGSIVVCITCLRLNAAGLYGIMGAAQCLLLIISACTTGDVLRIILAVLWYALAALVLLATVGGYLPGRLMAAVMFLLPVFVRFFFALGSTGLIGWVLELSVFGVLTAYACLAMGLKQIKQ